MSDIPKITLCIHCLEKLSSVPDTMLPVNVRAEWCANCTYDFIFFSKLVNYPAVVCVRLNDLRVLSWHCKDISDNECSIDKIITLNYIYNPYSRYNVGTVSDLTLRSNETYSRLVSVNEPNIFDYDNLNSFSRKIETLLNFS